MPLSAEQYLDLVSKQQDEKGFEMVDGHRRARRVPFIGMVEIQPIVNNEAATKVSVRLRDVSARGMAILDKWTAPKGTQFVASLMRQGGRPLRILCTITYSARLPGNLCRTGAEITCVLPDPQASARKPHTATQALTASADPGEAERIRRSILG